jgi:hypothetical protein
MENPMLRLSPSFASTPCRLAALSLALVLLAPSAGAVPQISQGTWTEYVNQVCYTTYDCSATFTAVPTGKTLIARNISCRLAMPPSTSSFAYVYLSTSPAGADRRHHLVFENAYTIQFTTLTLVRVANDDIFVPFVAGQRPSVRILATANASVIQLFLLALRRAKAVGRDALPPVLPGVALATCPT